MDFAWGAEVEAFRAEVRGFLDEHLPPALEDHLYATGTAHDPGFVRALGDRNWIAPEWPRAGFDALGPAEVHVLEEELTRADAPIYASTTSMMVGRVIRAVGSDELQAEILPKVVRGEVTIALGMSEPEAGSDVAARPDPRPPRRRRLGRSTDRRCSRPTPTSPTTCSCSPAPTPT